MHRIVILTLVVASFALLGAPVAADWLVLTDGGKIETAGPWRIEGKRVLFHLPNGTLTAVRLTEVDLDKSDQATLEAAQPVEPDSTTRAKASSPQSAALVLDQTNTPAARTQAVETSEEFAPPPADRNGQVSVVTWQEVSTPGRSVRIAGQITNGTQSLAANIQVVVSIFDENGGLVGRQPAELAKRSLRMGGSATFEVEFPAVYLFQDANFEVSFDPLTIAPVEPSDADEGEDAIGSP